MYSRILVALDGSPRAEQILPYVRMLAPAYGCRVELMQAFDPNDLQGVDPRRGVYQHQLDAAFYDLAHEYLERVKRDELAGLRNLVDCTVELGSQGPAYWIVTNAEQQPGTLIALTSHGRSGFTRWVFGSVASKVLSGATTPLLLLRAQETPPPAEVKLETVIVPLDGSSLSEQSLPHAVEVCKATNARLLVVESQGTQAETQPRIYLNTVAEQLAAQGVNQVEARLLDGAAANAIVDLAEATPNSIIVMGSHGRSGVARWALGSVTDRVAQQVNCPLIIVRAQR